MIEKVSIIMPAYNVEREIEGSIVSILEQTYDNLEIIIINDGSTDNTFSVIKRYASSDSRIKVINQKNSGQSVARNKGIDISTGDYIYFFDADDFLQKNAIFELVNQMRILNTDVVTFNANAVDLGRNTSQPYVRHRKVRDKVIYSRDNFLEKNKWNLTPVWIYFFKKSFLLDNNIRFIENIIYEDNMFYIDVMLHLKTISAINTTFFFYQKRTHSTITSSDNYEFKLKSLDTLKKLILEKRRAFQSNTLISKFLKYRYDVIDNTIIDQHSHGNFFRGFIYIFEEKNVNFKNIFFLFKLAVKRLIRRSRY